MSSPADASYTNGPAEYGSVDQSCMQTSISMENLVVNSPPCSMMAPATSVTSVKAVAYTPSRWSLTWSCLTPEEIRAAEILGWSQENWDLGINCPSSVGKSWLQLTSQEQEAAGRFGWMSQQWDAQRCPSMVTLAPARASPGREISREIQAPLTPTTSVPITPTRSWSPTIIERPVAYPVVRGLSGAQTLQSVVQKPAVMTSSPTPQLPLQMSTQLVSDPPLQTVFQQPVAATTLVTKAIEQPLGLTAQEVQAMIQQERSQIISILQDSIAQQTQVYYESMKAEVQQMTNAFNAITASYEERIACLEMDRTNQGFKQEVRQQMQHVDQAVTHLRNDQRAFVDSVAAQRQELQVQHQSLHQHVDTSLGELRSQANQALQEFAREVQTKLDARLGSGLQDRLQKAVSRALLEYDLPELKSAINFEKQARMGLAEALDAYRGAYLQSFTELRAEIGRKTLDESSLSRLSSVERNFCELSNTVKKRVSISTSNMVEAHGTQELQDLNKQVRELSLSLESYRRANMQTSSELSSRIDWALEKFSRLESESSFSKQIIFDR